MILPNYSTFRAAFAVGSALAADGLEVWPVGNLRINGFDGGFIGIPVPVTAFPLTISCNGLVDDPSPGGIYTTSYNWYLRQRDPGETGVNDLLNIAQHSDPKSGTVIINPSALGLSLYPTVNFDSVLAMFRHVELYCQRLSDKAIQYVQLDRAAMGV
jgi:hypothetical protein